MLCAMKIGRRLHDWRERKHLSLTRFARLVGVSRQTAYDWQNDKHPPSREHLPSIANVLTVPEWLIAGIISGVIDEDSEELLTHFIGLSPTQRRRLVISIKALKPAKKSLPSLPSAERAAVSGVRSSLTNV
jgi:transcriptional regulator with XRE-family HTH domain